MQLPGRFGHSTILIWSKIFFGDCDPMAWSAWCTGLWWDGAIRLGESNLWWWGSRRVVWFMSPDIPAWVSWDQGYLVRISERFLAQTGRRTCKNTWKLFSPACFILHAQYLALIIFNLPFCARNSSDILCKYPWPGRCCIRLHVCDNGPTLLQWCSLPYTEM